MKIEVISMINNFKLREGSFEALGDSIVIVIILILCRRVEFSTPAYNLLNALEKIGYRWLIIL